MRKLSCVMVLLTIIGVGLLVVSGVSTANATLIERDLFAVGDGLITLDTGTGFEWLDLTQTLNLSPVQIIAGAGGWTGLGFTYATTAQVTALFIASDPLNVLINSSTSDNFAGASLLLDLMGCTEDNGDGYKYGKGWAGLNEPGIGSIHRPWFVIYTPFSDGALYSPDGSATLDSPGPEHGNYLVRPAPVPVPSTIFLFGTSLLGLAVASRKKFLKK